MRRLANVVYYWLTQNAGEDERFRIDFELTEPIDGAASPSGMDDDWQRAFQGMT